MEIIREKGRRSKIEKVGQEENRASCVRRHACVRRVGVSLVPRKLRRISGGIGWVLVPGATSPDGNRYGAMGQGGDTRWQILLLWFLFVPVVIGQVTLEVGWRRGHVTVLSRWDDATQRTSVEDQHGWTALQPRVATLALPVAVAWLAQWHVAVRVVVAQSCNGFTIRLFFSFNRLRIILKWLWRIN